MDHREEFLKGSLLALLVKSSLPAMAGMLAIASYNLVDSIFIGHGVGPLGIAATSAALPLQLFVSGLAQWVAVGTSSMVARCLGAEDDESAELALGNGLFIALGLGIVTLVAGLGLMADLISAMGVDPGVAAYAKEYLGVIFWGNPLVLASVLLSSAIRAEGNTRYVMWAMTVPVTVNIFLDPVLIFGLGMGMRGAALATVTGEFVMLGWCLRYYLKGRGLVALRRIRMRLRGRVVREIVSVGASEFLHFGAMAGANGLLMAQFSRWGTPLHIAAYAIMLEVSTIAIMLVSGLGQGMLPVVGYCYGARDHARARRGIELSLALGVAISSVAEVILLVFPATFARAFTVDAEVVRLTVWGARILQSTFALVGLQIIGAAVFQVLGFAAPAAFASTCRLVVFFVPALLILPRFWGITGVFLSYPFADVAAAAVTIGMLWHYRVCFRQIESDQRSANNELPEPEGK